VSDRSHSAILAALVDPRPRVATHRPLPWLPLAALVAVALWLALDWSGGNPTNPNYGKMLSAARTFQAASRVIYAAKLAKGLLPPAGSDPNHTGMIGLVYTPITTTIGDLGSKRTTTNPDFTAALVAQLAALNLKPGAPVLIILSGSFLGGDVGSIIAAETLGLKPVTIASFGASQYGANNPEFNLVDMLALLHDQGVLHSLPIASVLGGEGAIADGIDPADVAMLRASAMRAGIPLVENASFPALIDDLMGRITVAAGGRPAAVLNVGGAQIGLGTCREAAAFPPGLTQAIVPCTAGDAGLVMKLAAGDLPVLHVLNIRELVIEWGLPFDPIPLPVPGNNPMVYGARPRT
jgi:poly-gamma-glutamate system protein